MTSRTTTIPALNARIAALRLRAGTEEQAALQALAAKAHILLAEQAALAAAVLAAEMAEREAVQSTSGTITTSVDPSGVTDAPEDAE